MEMASLNSVDEFYWEGHPRFHRELDAVRKQGEGLTGWLDLAGVYVALNAATGGIIAFLHLSKNLTYT